jgi:hypothetical protein
MADEIPTTLKMKFSPQKMIGESTNWRIPAEKIDVNGDFVQKNVSLPAPGHKGRLRCLLYENRAGACSAKTAPKLFNPLSAQRTARDMQKSNLSVSDPIPITVGLNMAQVGL